MASSISASTEPPLPTCSWSAADRRAAPPRPAARRRPPGDRGGPRRLPARQGVLRIHEPRGGPHPRPLRCRAVAGGRGRGCRCAGTAVTGAGGARLHGRFALAGHRPFRPTGLSVSRRILDAELLAAARAAGAVVRERVAVEDLLDDERGVAGARVRLEDGTALDADRAAHRRRGRPALDRRPANRPPAAGRPPPHGLRRPHGAGRRHGRLRRDVRRAARVPRAQPDRRGPDQRGPRGARASAPAPRGDAPTRVLPRGTRRFPGGPGADRERHDRPRGPGHRSLRRVVRAESSPTAPRWSATPPTSSTPSPAKASTARFGAPSCWPRRRAPRWRPRAGLRAAALAAYRTARRRAFGGKWAVERLIGYGMQFPALFDRAVSRLGRRRAWPHTLIGVTADFVPARAVLNPLFLARMLL